MTGQDYLKTLSKESFYYDNLLSTIASAYEDGKRDSDNKWKDAILKYFEEMDIPAIQLTKIYKHLK